MLKVRPQICNIGISEMEINLIFFIFFAQSINFVTETIIYECDFCIFVMYPLPQKLNLKNVEVSYYYGICLLWCIMATGITPGVPKGFILHVPETYVMVS